LGDKNIVSTVVKRGYRLALDDDVDGHRAPPLAVAR
jgi:hypothetical protein